MFSRRRNSSSTRSPRSRHPDVVLIIVDDLRPDLGAFGNKNAQTPHIDALAASAVTFTAAFAAVANCAPSRASFLTGLRPDATGVLDLKTHVRDVDPLVVTLPQRFRRAGYLAVSYGKVFHQDLDDAASWSPQAEFADNETWRGLRGHAWRRAGGFRLGWRYNQYMTPQYQRAVGCAQPAECTRGGPRGAACAGCKVYARVPPFERGPESNANGAGYTDAVLATRAVRALRRLRAQPRPYFLAVGFIRPHLPFNAPARYFDAARSHAPPRAPALVGASAPTAEHVRQGEGELFAFGVGPRRVPPRSEHATKLRHGYAACVSFVDAQVGRVLDALRVPPDAARGGSARAGAAAAGDATIVALLGDHGWKLGHAGSWGKHSLLAADTRVPLLIRAPGVAPRRVGAHVELLDLFPTLVRLARLPDVAATSADGAAPPPPPRLHGRSLYPLMRAGDGAPRRGADERAAFSQWPFERKTFGHCMGYAVRVPGWTLLQWVRKGRGGLGRRRRAPPPLSARAGRALAEEGRPSCSAHADLYRTNDTASDLVEGANVLRHYPLVADKLRRMLAREMALPPQAVGLGGTRGPRVGQVG